MDLYTLHSNPETLDFHDVADNTVIELFWPKYKNNPEELRKREKAIATNARRSLFYARDTLKGRFPAGEATICKFPKVAIEYVLDIIGAENAREVFPQAEEIISTDADTSFQYALFVVKGPWKKGEAAIAKDSFYSFRYAVKILEGPFEKGERALAGDSSQNYEWAQKYANQVLKKDFYFDGKLIAKYNP